ncbi:MAG TPA: hypothetical protein DCE42_03520, partial [Myxococcales bacterium]|nr:hypothetical protein [Myxococcales bacterium]
LYFADEIVWNARFVDVIQTTETGQTVLDLTKFHDYELVEDVPFAEEH